MDNYFILDFIKIAINVTNCFNSNYGILFTILSINSLFLIFNWITTIINFDIIIASRKLILLIRISSIY